MAYYGNLIISDIDANRATYIHFLQDLIRAASPNPPGDTHQASEVIKTFLLNNDIEPHVIAPLPHALNVVASFNGLRGNGPRVLFNGHIDTFPLNHEVARQLPPCSGFTVDDKIHGLGAVDMKAGTAASIVAFTLLKNLSAKPTGSFALTAVFDEETGERYVTKYLLDSCGDAWKTDCVINGEPGGLQSIRFGEKAK
jgi:succinyl-diaminopimelate desuccinylase